MYLHKKYNRLWLLILYYINTMNLIDIYHNELCDLICRISIDKDGWLNFSKRLLEILDASYVHIQAIDLHYNTVSFSNGHGTYPKEYYASTELDYIRYPIEDDPRWEKFLDPNRKGWYQCHTHVSEDFVQSSDLYQKILLPVGLRYVATHELIWNEKLCVFLSISTTTERKPLNQTELEFLDTLLPHLKRVVMSQKNIYEFSHDNIVGYNLIDLLKQPIILLNLSGHVVHLNQKANFFLQNNKNIKIENNKLVLSACSQNQFIDYLYQVEKTFRYKPEELDQFKNSVFFTKNSNIQFGINLLVSEKEKSFFGIRPLIMLSFTENLILKDENIQPNKIKYVLEHETLKYKYKLSKREIEVCEWFVNGLKLEQISVQMNITLNSVRTYFKNIFHKMECNSQVELMQLLMNLTT